MARMRIVFVLLVSAATLALSGQARAADLNKRGQPYGQANASINFPNGWKNCAPMKKIEKRYRQDCTSRSPYPVVRADGSDMVMLYRNRGAYLTEKDQRRRLEQSGADPDGSHNNVPNMAKFNVFEGLVGEDGEERVPTIYRRVYPVSDTTAIVMDYDYNLYAVDLETGQRSATAWSGTSGWSSSRLVGRAAGDGMPASVTALVMETDKRPDGLRKATFVAADGTPGITLGNVVGNLNNEKSELGIGFHAMREAVVFRLRNPATGAIETVVTDRDGTNLRGLPPDTHYFRRSVRKYGWTAPRDRYTFIVPIAANPDYLGDAREIADTQRHLWWFLDSDGTPMDRPGGTRGFIPVLGEPSQTSFGNRIGDVTHLILVSEDDGGALYSLMELPRRDPYSVDPADYVINAVTKKNEAIAAGRESGRRAYTPLASTAVPSLQLLENDGTGWHFAFRETRDGDWLVTPNRMAWWHNAPRTVDPGIDSGTYGRGATLAAAWQDYAAREPQRRTEAAQAQAAARYRASIAAQKARDIAAYEQRRAQEQRAWEAERAAYQRQAARSVYTFSGGGGFGVGTASTTAPTATISSSDAYKAARERGVTICRNTGGSNCDR